MRYSVREILGFGDSFILCQSTEVQTLEMKSCVNDLFSEIDLKLHFFRLSTAGCRRTFSLMNVYCRTLLIELNCRVLTLI